MEVVQTFFTLILFQVCSGHYFTANCSSHKQSTDRVQLVLITIFGFKTETIFVRLKRCCSLLLSAVLIATLQTPVKPHTFALSEVSHSLNLSLSLSPHHFLHACTLLITEVNQAKAPIFISLTHSLSHPPFPSLTHTDFFLLLSASLSLSADGSKSIIPLAPRLWARWLPHVTKLLFVGLFEPSCLWRRQWRR